MWRKQDKYQRGGTVREIESQPKVHRQQAGRIVLLPESVGKGGSGLEKTASSPKGALEEAGTQTEHLQKFCESAVHKTG